MHEYSFRWTPSEYVRATHAMVRHMRGMLPLAPMCGIAGLVLFLAAAGSMSSPEAAWTLVAVGTLCMLLGAYLYWARPWQAAQRILNEDPCAREDIRHMVTPDGFAVRTGGVSVDVKWAHITRVVETKDFLLYYLNKRFAYFTPKRVIPASDLEPLRASIRRYVVDRAQLAPPS
jgi:hypothetical protein